MSVFSLLVGIAQPRRYLVWMLAAASLSFASCGQADIEDVKAWRSVLDSLGSIVLEEPDSAPIGHPVAVDFTNDGHIVVADFMLSRVRIHEPDGRLLRLVGQRGAGPGEFRQPRDVSVLRDGALVVADWGGGRIVRFGPDLVFDRVISVPGGYASEVESHPLTDRLLVGVRGQQTGQFGYLGEDSDYTPVYDWPDSIRSIPGWYNVAIDYATAGTSHVVIANNLRYPLFRLTWGDTLPQAFGSPPTSWRPARVPERDQFRSKSSLAEWLNSFDVIAGVHLLSDSIVVVSRGSFDARESMSMPEMFRPVVSSLDFYALDGTGMITSIVAPGRVAHADTLLHVYTSEPPGPYRLTAFRFRGGR